MRAYCVIAAALAAFATGSLQSTPSFACTQGQCPGTKASAPGKPLQLTKQKSTRAPAKESRRKRVRAPKKAPVEEAVTAEEPVKTDAATASGNRAPETTLPVVVVRTTRESGDEPDVPVVSADEFSDLDRAAPSSRSLLTSTIANYLGRPDLFEEVNSPPVVNTEDFSAEVKQAFAAEPEEQQKPAEVALEYILMTFGGALAAASAIRLFAV